MKISAFNGVANTSDDSVLMISFTTDGGASYQTKKIRMADMIDDFDFDDLASTDLSGLSVGDLMKWNGTSWVPVTGASGVFTSNDSKTITVTGGIITNIS